MRKLLLVSIVALLFVFSLAGCASNNKQNATNDQTAKKQDLLQKVKDKGELLIGTEGTYPPFTFNENGKLTGFDVEIAKEVAKRLGVKPVFMQTQWDAMFAGLDAKRFDMIANEVGIKPERQEKYDFSTPYISSSAVLITRKDNNNVKSFADIKGLKSAQSLTSNYGKIAKSNGAELVGVPGFNEAVELLESKRVDVTVNDKLSVLDYLKHKPDANIKIAATAEDAAQSAFMFRKGNKTLVDAVNKALQDMMDDGTYLEISKKWFGEDVRK